MAWYKCKGVKKAEMVDSFSVATWATNTACGYWEAPSSGKFDGVRIVYSTVSAPTSPDEGVLFYEGTGSDLKLTTVTEVHGATANGFTTGLTYYFSCFSYIGSPHKYNKSKYKTAQWIAVSCAGIYTPDTGTWTVPTGVRSLDIFAAGGGGGGGGGWRTSSGSYYSACGGGGGGGYTDYDTAIAVIPGMEITIALGSGGYGGGERTDGGTGGTTTISGTDANGNAFTVSATGGTGGNGSQSYGGNGGSGGGSGKLYGASGSVTGGDGGTDGGNGNGSRGGTGQNSTTKPFGDESETPYSGGGGGGGLHTQYFAGGNYGGGYGGTVTSGTTYRYPSAGTAQTGGGGGGSAWYYNQGHSGASGGTGLAYLKSA